MLGMVMNLVPHPIWMSNFAAQKQQGANEKIFIDSEVYLATNEPMDIYNSYNLFGLGAHCIN